VALWAQLRAEAALGGARDPVRPWTPWCFWIPPWNITAGRLRGLKASLERNRNPRSRGDVRRPAPPSALGNPRPVLQFAARFEAGVDGMEHDDFVSQGATGKTRWYGANLRPSASDSAFSQRASERDAEALKSLWTRGPRLLQVAYKAALPAPPTSAQVAKMYLSEGAENLQALAALVKGNDADLVVGAAALLFGDGATARGEPANLAGRFCRARLTCSAPWGTPYGRSGTRRGRARPSRRRLCYCRRMALGRRTEGGDDEGGRGRSEGLLK